MTRKLRNNFVQLVNNKAQKENRIIEISDIARESGLSYNVVDRWAKGDVRRFDEDIIVQICEYLNCDVGDLLTIRQPTPSI